MIEDFPTMSMNKETVDWLTKWVEELKETDEVASKRLDGFVKNMDVVFDRLNTMTLYSTVMTNAVAAAHEVIVQMHKELVTDESAELSEELVKRVDAYATAQMTVSNMRDAFLTDEDEPPK